MQPPAYRAEAEDGGLVGEKRKRKETGENVKKTRRKGKEKKRDWSITSLRYIGTSLQCVWCARNHACTHGCTPSRTHARTHAPHFLRCDKVVFFSLFFLALPFLVLLPGLAAQSSTTRYPLLPLQVSRTTRRTWWCMTLAPAAPAPKGSTSGGTYEYFI